MRYAFLLGTVGLLILAIGCMPAPLPEDDTRGELMRVERDFDPLAQDRERPIVIPRQGQDSIQTEMPPVEQPSPGLPGDSLEAIGPGVIQGYRVQIFLSDSLQEAVRVMTEAREHFEEEIYLEYAAPYYKVRVGDCQTEMEGQRLLRVAHRLGYRDAWLVYTMISVPEESEPR
jgi:hypothetical protein